MASYVYINITENHFKVWGYDLFVDQNSGEVIAYWGRIGISMQRLNKNRKQFDIAANAFDYARKKCDEKLCKGYKGFPNWLYFQMIQSSRGIAALIEKISNMDIGQQYWSNPKRKSH